MDQTTIDSYLLNEMSDAEREKFEDAFIGDNELFFEIAERENDLVDRYLKGELTGVELDRFETSLASNPARRQKIANGRALREFIADERAESKTITIAERSGFFAKLADLFTFRSYAFQFASIGLITLLALASILLLVENRGLRSLEAELTAARERESKLTAQIENAQDATDELTTDLNAERQRIRDLETEIAGLRKTPSDVRPTPGDAVKPTIATLLLSPAIRRGPGPALVQRVEIPSGVSRVAVVLTLSSEAPDVQRVSVRLNGEPAAESIRVRSRANGERSVSLTIPVSKINDTRNDVVVIDGSGKTLGEYAFAISRQK